MEEANASTEHPTRLVGSGRDHWIAFILLAAIGGKMIWESLHREDAENHAYSVAIHFMHYNFARIHQSLRTTPAMAAGVTPKLWSLTDMVRVVEDWEIARWLKISGKTMVG